MSRSQVPRFGMDGINPAYIPRITISKVRGSELFY